MGQPQGQPQRPAPAQPGGMGKQPSPMAQAAAQQDQTLPAPGTREDRQRRGFATPPPQQTGMDWQNTNTWGQTLGAGAPQYQQMDNSYDQYGDQDYQYGNAGEVGLGDEFADDQFDDLSPNENNFSPANDYTDYSTSGMAPAENTPGGWIANRMGEFGELVAQSLVQNRHIDEGQYGLLMGLLQEQMAQLAALADERFNPAPQNNQMTIQIPLPMPGQFENAMQGFRKAVGVSAGNGFFQKGGVGSGHHRHRGRPGERGGSAPDGAGGAIYADRRIDHDPAGFPGDSHERRMERIETSRANAIPAQVGELKQKRSQLRGRPAERVDAELGQLKREYGTLATNRSRWAGQTDEMLEEIRANGGFSHRLSDPQDSKVTGYFVSIKPQYETIVPLADLTEKDIYNFIVNNADQWAESSNVLGAWVSTPTDPETGAKLAPLVYLDISTNVADRATAEQLGNNNKQIAIYYVPEDGSDGYEINLNEYYRLNPQVPRPEAEKGIDMQARSLMEASISIPNPKIEMAHVRRFPTLQSGLDEQIAIKSLAPNRVGAYAVIWGDRGRKDLSGEYFTPKTEGLLDVFNAMGGVPAIYHHAMDDTLKSIVLGVVDTMERDDTGVWIEAQIKEHDYYKRFINPLVSQKMLGWSSGSLPGARRVERDGEIKRWTIVEASMTPTPMEWRMATQYPIGAVKSIYRMVGLDESVVDEAEVAFQQAARADDDAQRARIVKVQLGLLRAAQGDTR